MAYRTAKMPPRRTNFKALQKFFTASDSDKMRLLQIGHSTGMS